MPTKAWPTLGLWSLLAALLIAPVAGAQTSRQLEYVMQGVDVVERIGEPLPQELRFLDDNGREVRLGQYLREGRPLLITLNYADCPRLCNLQLLELAKALRELSWTPGKEYVVLTVSIDPNETYERSRLSKMRYLNAITRPEADLGWHFLVTDRPGDDSEVRTLANALGFGYKFDPNTGEWIHKAAAFIVNGDGVISHYLRNLNYIPAEVQSHLEASARGEFGAADQDEYGFGMNCLVMEFTDNMGRAFNMMRVGGVGILVFLFSYLGYWWTREWRRSRRQKAEAI
jgi:protein SCO1